MLCLFSCPKHSIVNVLSLSYCWWLPSKPLRLEGLSKFHPIGSHLRNGSVDFVLQHNFSVFIQSFAFKPFQRQIQFFWFLSCLMEIPQYFLWAISCPRSLQELNVQIKVTELQNTPISLFFIEIWSLAASCYTTKSQISKFLFIKAVTLCGDYLESEKHIYSPSGEKYEQ